MEDVESLDDDACGFNWGDDMTERLAVFIEDEPSVIGKGFDHPAACALDRSWSLLFSVFIDPDKADGLLAFVKKHQGDGRIRWF